MVHGVGADTMAQFNVYEGGRMTDANIEVHRAQAAQNLFTDVSLGKSTEGFYSGGPPVSGPNAGAFTVWWNIRRCAWAAGWMRRAAGVCSRTRDAERSFHLPLPAQRQRQPPAAGA